MPQPTPILDAIDTAIILVVKEAGTSNKDVIVEATDAHFSFVAKDVVRSRLWRMQDAGLIGTQKGVLFVTNLGVQALCRTLAVYQEVTLSSASVMPSLRMVAMG